MGEDDRLINDVVAEMNSLDEKEEEIEFIASPHFSRRTATVDTIIIHYTGANRIASTINWFQDPVSKVSAHYVIGRDGRIVQMVDCDKKAWHAGASIFRGRQNINNTSIGIEMVGTKDSGFTSEQYSACAKVCALMIEQYSIPIDRIVGHEDIAGDEAVALGIRTESNKKIDPGKNWSWDEFHACLTVLTEQSIVDDEPELINDDDNNKELYTPDKMMRSGKDPEPESIILKIIIAILRLFSLKSK